MEFATVANVGGALTGIISYLGWKANRLPSEADVRNEIEERLRGKHTIPTPLAARRHDEVHWSGDFHITVESVDVYEEKWRRKWIPTKGFSGITSLELEFHQREAPSEEELYDSFLGNHPLFHRFNKHIDNPNRLNVRVDTADPDTVCGHVFGSFRKIILEIEFEKDNPEIDPEWLTHQQNTVFGHKNGNLYDIMNERVVMPIGYPAGRDPPDNIPPKESEAEE